MDVYYVPLTASWFVLGTVGKIPINRYILAATDGLIRFDQFARADMSLVYQTP